MTVFSLPFVDTFVDYHGSGRITATPRHSEERRMKPLVAAAVEGGEMSPRFEMFWRRISDSAEHVHAPNPQIKS